MINKPPGLKVKMKHVKQSTLRLMGFKCTVAFTNSQFILLIIDYDYEKWLLLVLNQLSPFFHFHFISKEISNAYNIISLNDTLLEQIQQKTT